MMTGQHLDEWTIEVGGTLLLSRSGSVVDLRPKERAVLAAIAFEHPRPATIDTIASLVWESNMPATGRKSIHNHIARIRSTAGELIVTSGNGYALAAGCTIDETGDPGVLPFHELADVPEVDARRSQILAAVDATEDDELEHLVQIGDSNAIPRLIAATTSQPLNEHRWWLLIAELAHRSKRRDALLACVEVRNHLVEAGLEPGERLRDLERLIIADSPKLMSANFLADILVAPASTASIRPASAIHPHHDDPFVGRTAELESLHTTWKGVTADRRPRVVIIEGSPGMGKTRLVDRFISQLDTPDDHEGPSIRVMWGRNRGAIDRAYGFLIESLSDVLRSEPDLIERAGDALAGMAHLFPQLSHLADRRPPEGEEFMRSRLAQAMRTLMSEVAATPTVWFVDDLQWASADTIAVIGSAIDGLRGELLIIATARSTDGSIADGVATLQRTLPTTTMPLADFTVDEIASLFSQSGYRVEGAYQELANLVHQRTSGLPLYASEIARFARLSGADIETFLVPDAVRDWVSRRVRALDETLIRLIQTAAVIGQDLDIGLLTRCLGDSAAQVAERCDRLVAAGLLTATHDEHAIGDLQFSHAITRDIVYDDIGPATRSQLHRHVADTLSATTQHVNHAELALHYSRAGTDARATAAHHALLAGEHDFGIGSWKLASTHFELSASLAPNPQQRAEALVALGRALLRQDRYDHAARELRAAIEIARHEGFAPIQARATLELVGRAGRGAAVDTDDSEHTDLLRAARRALKRYRPATPAAQRDYDIEMSNIERELAYVLLLSDAVDEREQLLITSLERMRALSPPDPMTLANSLLGVRYTKLSPDALDSRIADIDEVLAMSPSALDHEVLLAAHCYRIEDLIRLGDFDEALGALDDAQHIVASYPNPYWAWAIRAWRGQLELIGGNTDLAEATALEAFAMRPGVAEAEASLSVNLINIRLHQGRAAEVLEPLETAIERFPELPLYRAVLAMGSSQSGGQQRAHEILTDFAATGFRALPNDPNRFMGLAVLAHTAADLCAASVGDTLRRLLLPYRGQWVTLSTYGAGGGTWGPAAHALARLAVLTGDLEAADQLFVEAAHQARHAPLVRVRIERDHASLR